MAIRSNMPLEINIRNAIINWIDVSDAPSAENPNGKAHIAIIVDDGDVATAMMRDGWPVKEKTNNDGDVYYTMNIKVDFRHKPPKIRLFTNRSDKFLKADTVCALESAEIERADIQAVQYNYKTPMGQTGISAYLKTLYCKIKCDPFEEEWEDMYRHSDSDDGEYDD